jgi:GNAT superfamily N-acetyltransferase
MPLSPGFIIRPRLPADVDACVAVLEEVHTADGYPLIWPADPYRWLDPRGLLTAWVAEDAGRVIGHIILSRAEGAGAARWSGACSLPPQSLASVRALFVSPAARGHGVGAALLTHALKEARSSGRHAALEVLEYDRAAIALYERTGWTRVGSEPAAWAQEHGTSAMIHFYIAPD